ncbi:hypothetical protein PMIN03_004740 [Paraphaeosphaeria minitans]
MSSIPIISFAAAVTKGANLSLIRDTFESNSAASTSQSPCQEYADLAHYRCINAGPEPNALDPLSKCLQDLVVDDRLDTEGGKNVRMFYLGVERPTRRIGQI